MGANEELAGEYQSKFRFYFVALTFTLLAATIQTVVFSEMNPLNSFLELLGWFSLLASGLSGLTYLEYTPVIYSHFDAINKATGDRKKQFEEQLKRIKARLSFLYAISKFGFVVGLLLVTISRAIHGLHPAMAI